MKTESFYMPCKGQPLAIEELKDDNFATGNLGPGFAIKLSGSTLHAPFDGVVIACFPSGHAFIIRRADGYECLMHVGVRSHTLSQAFKSDIVKYQKVKQGDVLTKFDLSMFNEDNRYCPIVFSNPSTKVDLKALHQDLEVGDNKSIFVSYE